LPPPGEPRPAEGALAATFSGPLPPEALGLLVQALRGAQARRRFGIHYTPPALARAVVTRTLRDRLGESPTPDALRSVRVGDPAAGGGVFLLETARHLAALLQRAGFPERSALHHVVSHSLAGVDIDPLAVEATRLALWLLVGDPELPAGLCRSSIRTGDALLDDARHLDGALDCVVGNPPFGGKNTRSAAHGPDYLAALRRRWPHAHGAADLCAYFFLRGVELLRPGGTFGLIATNTIGQGHTRDTGLRHLLARGVTLTAAQVDVRWPSPGASVVVSVVHGTRGQWTGTVERDSEPVVGLSSDLSAGVERPVPHRLTANQGRSFQGQNLVGRGFLLAPSEANALLDREPQAAEILRGYVGARDLQTGTPSPDGSVPAPRVAIDLGRRTLGEAGRWPCALALVRERVKPARDRSRRASRRRLWWQFGETAPGLRAALAGLSRCLVVPRVGRHLLISLQPTDRVLSEGIVVFARNDWFSFALLQSRVHEVWARQVASSLKTDLRYTPSRCFEAFPQPRPTPEAHAIAARAGRALFSLRHELLTSRQEGLTRLWNRVCDPSCREPGVVELRRRRDDMNRAILRCYGWPDCDPTDDDPTTRLWALNAERAAEERQGEHQGQAISNPQEIRVPLSPGALSSIRRVQVPLADSPMKRVRESTGVSEPLLVE